MYPARSDLMSMSSFLTSTFFFFLKDGSKIYVICLCWYDEQELAGLSVASAIAEVLDLLLRCSSQST